MEDSSKSRERRLVRCCERHRFEAQLLLLAYEQIQPVIRRSVSRHEQQPRESTLTPTAQTRSA
jgi:hypothetical protein